MSTLIHDIMVRLKMALNLFQMFDLDVSFGYCHRSQRTSVKNIVSLPSENSFYHAMLSSVTWSIGISKYTCLSTKHEASW